MRRSRHLAIGLAVLGLCWATGAQAAAEVKVGAWRILSGTSSAGGTYCTMQLGDQTKGVGLQLVSDGTVYLMVASPDWQFEAKQLFPATYAIDDRPAWDGNAIAVTPSILVISLPARSDPVATLAGGKVLAAKIAAGAPVTFVLDGAGAARDALKTCLAPSAKP